METIDSGKITILTALDMSAAFDTMDHTTLLHRLQQTFGLSGYVISWICSYLTDRSSFVKIYSSSSPSTTILTGKPQGSVLGPLLFVSFISPIANVMNSDQLNQNNIVSFHQYADDTQLYPLHHGLSAHVWMSCVASGCCCRHLLWSQLINWSQYRDHTQWPQDIQVLHHGNLETSVMTASLKVWDSILPLSK